MEILSDKMQILIANKTEYETFYDNSENEYVVFRIKDSGETIKIYNDQCRDQCLNTMYIAAYMEEMIFSYNEPIILLQDIHNKYDSDFEKTGRSIKKRYNKFFETS